MMTKIFSMALTVLIMAGCSQSEYYQMQTAVHNNTATLNYELIKSKQAYDLEKQKMKLERERMDWDREKFYASLDANRTPPMFRYHDQKNSVWVDVPMQQSVLRDRIITRDQPKEDSKVTLVKAPEIAAPPTPWYEKLMYKLLDSPVISTFIGSHYNYMNNKVNQQTQVALEEYDYKTLDTIINNMPTSTTSTSSTNTETTTVEWPPEYMMTTEETTSEEVVSE